MIWITNDSKNEINCPHPRCGKIQPGETHRDTSSGHEIEEVPA